MARLFDRNIFIMLLSIMVGVIIITFFVADIRARSEEEEKYSVELSSIQDKNFNFTNYFIKSSVLLDKARENRAVGNYHFELGLIWYQSALSEKNISRMELNKIRGIENCTSARPYFYISNLNFLEAKDFFKETKSLTNHIKYINILNLYTDLTSSGSNLTMLRYEASIYLKYLIENLTFNTENNNVTYLENVTELLEMFGGAVKDYEQELDEYEEYEDAIDEYEFFDEIR